MKPVECPSCHEINNIRKVSDIYEEGSQQQKSNWMRFFVTRSHSGLAQKLAPPREPEYPKIEGAMTVFAVILFLITINEIRNPEMLLPAIGLGLFAGGLIVYQVFHYRKVSAAYRRDLPEWELAILKWKNTCYCKNCDLVFDPITMKNSPAGNIDRFLR